MLLGSLLFSIVVPAYAESALPTQVLNKGEIAPYQIKATNSSWEEKEIDSSFYDNAYQRFSF
jgi:hypothetical protein